MSGEALKSISIENLRGCVAPFTVPFEKGKKLTIIYGDNGSGKSTICDAFEFVSLGNVGSLDGRGLGQTQKYWSTVRKNKGDIVVELKTNGGTYRASLARSAVAWSPANCRPKLEVLRRSQILKLVEARPADRYNEISRFINVSGVEASEASLKTLIDTVKGDRESQISRLQGSKDTLEKLFRAAGGAGHDPVAWARQEVNRDFSTFDEEAKPLASLEAGFHRLSTHLGTWIAVQQRLGQAQERVELAEDVLVASLNDVGKDASDIIDILTAATRFLTNTPEPTSCPLCESTERVSELAERVGARIEALRSLKEAKEALVTAKKGVEMAVSEADRLKSAYAKDCDAFRETFAGRDWSDSVPLPLTECPDDLAEFDGWHKANQALVEKWRALSNKWIEEKNASIQLTEALKAYDENLELPADAEALIPRLEKALHLAREERHAFTDDILSKIADEVGRLYEIAHPGEGLQEISLELDPKKRASLHLGAGFCGTSGVPPQAYFSDSHLDTLGLCVFLALAKMEDPSDIILVIDDVLASVDEPHVERLIELICEEANGFRHCVITTHYRPWREKYRWGWLKNGRCQFIELGKWSDSSGLCQTRSVAEVERLERLLNESNPDVQAICGKAGVVLEATLDFLTQLYHCKVPRRADGKYTLGDLLPSINNKLRAALYVEVLTKNGEEGREYQSYPLGKILDDLAKIAQARNVFGAHFNELSFELLDSVALEFSNKVLELSRLLTDDDRAKSFSRKILSLNRKLPSVLDNRPGRWYKALQYAAGGDPVLEPTRGHRATGSRSRGRALSSGSAGASLSGLAAQDRPHPVVCGHPPRPLAGRADLLRCSLKVCAP